MSEQTKTVEVAMSENTPETLMVETKTPEGWDKVEPGPEQTMHQILGLEMPEAVEPNPMDLVNRQIEGLRKEVEDAKAETATLSNELVSVTERAVKAEAFAAKSNEAAGLLYDFLRKYPYIDEKRNAALKEAMTSYRQVLGLPESESEPTPA